MRTKMGDFVQRLLTRLASEDADRLLGKLALVAMLAAFTALLYGRPQGSDYDQTILTFAAFTLVAAFIVLEHTRTRATADEEHHETSEARLQRIEGLLERAVVAVERAEAAIEGAERNGASGTNGAARANGANGAYRRDSVQAGGSWQARFRPDNGEGASSVAVVTASPVGLPAVASRAPWSRVLALPRYLDDRADKTAIAYHESGHALAYIVTGRDVTLLSINSERCDRAPGWVGVGPANPTWRGRMLASLAGYVAELRYCEEAGVDFPSAGSEANPAFVRRVLLAVDANHPTRDPLASNATAIVFDRWPVVESLARAVLASPNGRLSGEQVRAVCDDPLCTT